MGLARRWLRLSAELTEDSPQPGAPRKLDRKQGWGGGVFTHPGPVCCPKACVRRCTAPAVDCKPEPTVLSLPARVCGYRAAWAVPSRPNSLYQRSASTRPGSFQASEA